MLLKLDVFAHAFFSQYPFRKSFGNDIVGYDVSTSSDSGCRNWRRNRGEKLIWFTRVTLVKRHSKLPHINLVAMAFRLITHKVPQYVPKRHVRWFNLLYIYSFIIKYRDICFTEHIKEYTSRGFLQNYMILTFL